MVQPNSIPASADNPPAQGPNEEWLIWIDLEMSGLSPETDRIIEVAVIVTDAELRIVAESPAYAVHQPEIVLDGMDQWNKSTHGRSGLVDRVRASTLSEADVERAVIDFLRPLVPAGKSPMCGNSVCQDRRFLARYMPQLESWFHYRNLDVSTLKELCKRWKPAVAKAFVKRSAHTALADIRESIDELGHYREHFLAP